MPSIELITLVLQGGAVVVLLLWVADLRKQREQERAERLENAAVMRTVSQSLAELTAAVRESMPLRSRR
jgi:hypothetical protein